MFNNCMRPIRQVELARNFKLNANGLMALSRNSNEVRQESFPARTAIIGTYNFEAAKLTLVARRVDIESATYLAVNSKEVTWSCEDPPVGEKRLVFKVK